MHFKPEVEGMRCNHDWLQKLALTRLARNTSSMGHEDLSLKNGQHHDKHI